MKLQRIDHVGIIVNDLPAATAFFLDLGLEVKGEAKMEGELLDNLLGLSGTKTEFVMLGFPDGEASLEIIKFLAPSHANGIQDDAVNALGIRHVAFVVDDMEAVVAHLKQKGYEVFSEVQNYENIYKLCYCRGPEGIILDLAQEIE